MIVEIEPEPFAYVEKIKAKQSDQLQLCELEVTMSSIEYWLPKNKQQPSLIQKVGDCGMKRVIDEHTWEFSKSNYFLGMGGVPNGKWLSIGPFTVPV